MWSLEELKKSWGVSGKLIKTAHPSRFLEVAHVTPNDYPFLGKELRWSLLLAINTEGASPRWQVFVPIKVAVAPGDEKGGNILIAQGRSFKAERPVGLKICFGPNWNGDMP